MITLVAKKPDASKVMEFWLIALCNVLYKLIAKILATRLQGVLPLLINASQSAFVKGRSIMDNMMLAHQLVKHYECKHISPIALVEMDICKAYDTMSWEFLEATLLALGFPDAFVRLIMVCVSTPSYSVNINRTPCGY